MFSSKSRSHAERTVQSGRELQKLTAREAMQTVGGCGRRQYPGYAPSTSSTAPGSGADPTVGGINDATL